MTVTPLFAALYNPAVAFGLAAIKIISWRTMAVAWTGQFVGAFLGALIVWIIYFAHFQPVYGGPDSGRGIPFWQETSAEAHRFASAGNHLLKEAQLLRPEIDAVHPLRQWVNKVRGRGVRKRGGQGGGEGRASEEGKMERTNSKVRVCFRPQFVFDSLLGSSFFILFSAKASQRKFNTVSCASLRAAPSYLPKGALRVSIRSTA